MSANTDLPVPALLFPLKIETRFVETNSGVELWIRIFPDDAFLQSHLTEITKEERLAVEVFNQAVDKEKAWGVLVNEYGVYRAAYLAHLNEQDLPEVKEALEPTFYYKWLPNKFIVYLYEKGDKKPFLRIEKDKKEAERLVVFGEGDEWMSDFGEALSNGMGFKIGQDKLEGVEEFERIIVTGYYKDDGSDVKKSTGNLAELFENHLYTEGISLLEYGTPTNNIGQLKSGFSARDEYDAAGSFDLMVKGQTLEEGTAGQRLAHGLGLSPSMFQHFKNADLQASNFTELLQKLSWFALGGDTLKMLFGDLIANTSHERIWRHFSNFTKARGPYHAIKIGDQPYGILPVTKVRYVENEEQKDPVLVQAYAIFSVIFNKWKTWINEEESGVPRIFESANVREDIVKILSMEPSSIALQVSSKGYGRIRGKVPQWLQLATELPVSLSSLPLGQLYDLLQNFNASSVAGEIQPIAEQQQRISQLFEKFLTAEYAEEKILHSPMLSFSEVKKVQKIVNLPELNEGEISLKLFPENPEAVFKFFDDLKESTEAIPVFYGETTLFSDLLFKGYTNALNLYQRTIYFSPLNEDLKGYKALWVGKIFKKANEEANKGAVILEIFASKKENRTTIDKKIPVTMPFAGKIEEGFFVKENDLAQPGMRLFSIVNESKQAQVKADLLQSVAALKVAWTQTNEEERQTALQEVVDLNSYRIDAWITAFATERLHEIRQLKPEGVYLGAYGWVENLKRDTEKPAKEIEVEENGQKIKAYVDENRADEGGIIHCPTPAQSVAASVFKNSFLSQIEEGYESNPFALNLTSDRIQHSEQLMQGIRQDQEIEALLGYKLERWLHESQIDQHEDIYMLREKYPLEVNIMNRARDDDDIGFKQLSVINGLRMIEDKNWEDENGQKINKLKQKLQADYGRIEPFVEKLEDLLDGSMDYLLFEAGYQLTQGNISQSAAAMDAAKGALAPPKLESLKTRIPGVGISHQLAYLFPQPTRVFEKTQCKAFVAPVLENWLKEQLGTMEKIGCMVQLLTKELQGDEEVFVEKETVAVKLADLEIGYLDFLYLSDNSVSDGVNELELRIWNYVKYQVGSQSEDTSYKITRFAPANCQSLVDAIEVVQYCFQLLTNSRAVKSDDLAMIDSPVVYDWEALKVIRNERVVTLKNELKKWGEKPNDYLPFLSNLNLTEAKRAFFSKTAADEAIVKAAIAKMIAKVDNYLNLFDEQINEAEAIRSDYHQIFEHLHQAVKIFFGKSFILLPPSMIADEMADLMDDEKQRFLIGNEALDGHSWGQERIQTWIQELAQVNKGAAAFEEWQMTTQVWQEFLENENPATFKIAQYPSLDKYPWVGLDEEQIQALLDSDVYAGVMPFQPDADDANKYYPQGSRSLVINAHEGMDFSKTQFGIVIEEFTESIPDKTVDTGLSFNYNGPNNEAPQVLLLAVPPYGAPNAWNEDDLSEIIYDTMDLMKIRLMDLEAQPADFPDILPMTNIFNIPSTN